MRRRNVNPFVQRSSSGPTGISFTAMPNLEHSQPRTSTTRADVCEADVCEADPSGVGKETVRSFEMDDNLRRDSSLSILTNLAASRESEAATKSAKNGVAHCDSIADAGGGTHLMPQDITKQADKFDNYYHGRTELLTEDARGRPNMEVVRSHSSPLSGAESDRAAREMESPEGQLSHSTRQQLDVVLSRQHPNIHRSHGHLANNEHQVYAALRHQMTSPYSHALGAHTYPLDISHLEGEASRRTLLRAGSRYSDDFDVSGGHTSPRAAFSRASPHYRPYRAASQSQLPVKIEEGMHNNLPSSATGANAVKDIFSVRDIIKRIESHGQHNQESNIREQPYLIDYSVGLALRHGVIMPLVKSAKEKGSSLAVTMSIELGKYFRGECIWLQRTCSSNEFSREKHQRSTKLSGRVHQGGYAAEIKSDGNCYVSAFTENASSVDAKVVDTWYFNSAFESGGDSLLSYANFHWNTEWREKLLSATISGDSVRPPNREILKLVGNLRSSTTKAERKDDEFTQVILGFAYIERNGNMREVEYCREANLSKPSGGDLKVIEGTPEIPDMSKQTFTRLLDLRVAPNCNLALRERLSWCSSTLFGNSETSPCEISEVELSTVLLNLLQQTLHRSLLYGTSGVVAHCPKDPILEDFFEKQMGSPLWRDKDGRFVFMLTGQERLDAVKQGFKFHSEIVFKKG